MVRAMARDSGPRARGAAAFVLTSASVLCAVAAGVACITTPPPDLPELPPQPPTIVHDAVYPPEGVLVTWPQDLQFTVPVRMAKPGEKFFYEVIYDYGTPSQFVFKDTTAAPVIAVGGIEILPLPRLQPPTDTTICPHEIEVVVAAAFLSIGTPDAIGGDAARWTYIANGSPARCPPYDAGTGAFPEAGDR
jgi:hypothetical protein